MEHEGSTRTILLALYRNKGETWLFPFIGDRDLINEQQKNFESFLASTTLRAGEVEIRAKAPELPPPPAHDQHGAPTWEVPSHWIKTSASSMRLASYEVKDGNGSKLDFSVTSFPGDVGGTLANVNRWLGQIGIDPVKEEGLEKYITPIILDEKEAQLVVAEGEKDALYAAILMIEDRSWFFKITGNRELAKVEKSNFLSFLEKCLLPLTEMAIYNEKKKKKKNTLGARRKKFAWLVPLASIRLTLLLLSLSMILVFVATLEQVRIGIRGALAEYFESMYGIWHYPEQFWGSEHLSAFPIPIPGGYLLGGLLILNPHRRLHHPFSMDR